MVAFPTPNSNLQTRVRRLRDGQTRGKRETDKNGETGENTLVVVVIVVAAFSVDPQIGSALCSGFPTAERCSTQFSAHTIVVPQGVAAVVWGMGVVVGEEILAAMRNLIELGGHVKLVLRSGSIGFHMATQALATHSNAVAARAIATP